MTDNNFIEDYLKLVFSYVLNNKTDDDRSTILTEQQFIAAAAHHNHIQPIFVLEEYLPHFPSTHFHI